GGADRPDGAGDGVLCRGGGRVPRDGRRESGGGDPGGDGRGSAGRTVPVLPVGDRPAAGKAGRAPRGIGGGGSRVPGGDCRAPPPGDALPSGGGPCPVRPVPGGRGQDGGSRAGPGRGAGDLRGPQGDLVAGPARPALRRALRRPLSAPGPVRTKGRVPWLAQRSELLV